MRVCDRHPRTKATGKILIEAEDEQFDLCNDCLYQIKEFIGNSDRESVEPKKKRRNLAAAK